jgi:hypothetical protein
MALFTAWAKKGGVERKRRAVSSNGPTAAVVEEGSRVEEGGECDEAQRLEHGWWGNRAKLSPTADIGRAAGMKSMIEPVALLMTSPAEERAL